MERNHLSVGEYQALSIHDQGHEIFPKIEKLINITEVSDPAKQAVLNLGVPRKYLNDTDNFQAILSFLERMSYAAQDAQSKHQPFETYLKDTIHFPSIPGAYPIDMALLMDQVRQMGLPTVQKIIRGAQNDRNRFNVPQSYLIDDIAAKIARARSAAADLAEDISRTHNAQGAFATALNTAVDSISKAQKKIDQATNSLGGWGGEFTNLGSTFLGAAAGQLGGKVALSAAGKAAPFLMRGAARFGLAGIAETLATGGLAEVAAPLLASPITWAALGISATAAGAGYGGYKLGRYIRQHYIDAPKETLSLNPPPNLSQEPNKSLSPTLTFHDLNSFSPPIPQSPKSNNFFPNYPPPVQGSLIKKDNNTLLEKNSTASSHYLTFKEWKNTSQTQSPLNAPPPQILHPAPQPIKNPPPVPHSFTATHHQNIDVNVNVQTGQDVSVALKQSRLH